MNFNDKVIYQIYVKSFMDSNGDGLGGGGEAAGQRLHVVQIAGDRVTALPEHFPAMGGGTGHLAFPLPLPMSAL